ncbi:MAG: nitrate reductase subunit alpha [Methanobacteriota archaeon]|nr:MAG: nitrate reductase subunit alpha [Euryarchaeota archaeon]
MKNWITDLIDPKNRQWEEFYRNRWQYDKVIRSTHGVNCTGGCSWNVFVKDGIITWELQATDYPLLEEKLPPYEPRGCQRGISASWYVYSPLRIKYPYIRNTLYRYWKNAKREHKDLIEAWASIVEDERKRKQYQQARGKGGFKRISWDEALEIIATSVIYTIKKYGPDRVFGFSPIPAMSYLSYGGGSRFLQLLGGVNLSFYDWYCDLPNSFPETWGEQTDVAESADWYNARYIVSMGSNLSMTRTPDVHFISEAKYVGTKFVCVAPDFSMAAKFADWWIPINAGTDHAMWAAVNHVILKEYYIDRQVPYFIDYLKKYTDTPFLVELRKDGDVYSPGQFLRANRLEKYKDVENGDWKLLVIDEKTKDVKIPIGTIGFRHAKEDQGKWNLLNKDHEGNEIDPLLTLLEDHDEVINVKFTEFGEKKEFIRGIPAKKLETPDGPVYVATSLDLLFGHFGLSRGLNGEYPADYDDETSPYTPAWQEKFTGIGRDTVIKLAREFATNAENTEGRSMVITGAGVNHWYYNSLMYRGPITALILTGCVGKNGGGLNHYVGQEKLTLMTSWLSVAMATDWVGPPRVQQTPTWHYIHSDQFRYEGDFSEYASLPNGTKYGKGNVADHIARAVRNGWMPFYPQFNKSPLKIIEEAKAAGYTDDDGIKKYVAEKINSGELKLSVEDPDAPENWPRVFFIWRGNALMSSAKGHEYFLRHYLGTHDNSIKDEEAKDHLKDVEFREPAPRGKMDLVVDINFRMDTSALYSDIVLPTAMWYEKNDLNTTDMHSFVHPLGMATPPAWEARSDWDIFKSFAKKVSELAKEYLPEPVKDIVTKPLAHDSPDELSQPTFQDWKYDDIDYIPGKTGFHLAITERNYVDLYNRFISYGPKARENGLGAHGIRFDIKDIYDELASLPTTRSPDPKHMRAIEWGGKRYPRLEDALDAINLILALAPESNGELAYRAFKTLEAKTGLTGLSDLADDTRSIRYTFEDLKTQPRRILTSPFWSGIVNNGRAYTGYAQNVEKYVPWRTLSGRQHLYLDHPLYVDFGEQFPTFKPKLVPKATGDVDNTSPEKSVLLNYITPHGKWHIHSTYGDNLRMQELSRGCYPAWIHPDDAKKIGVEDNDWVEVINDNGVVVTRIIVSSRIPRGTCWIYHSPERTVSVPKSEERGKRGGGHNSLTRVKLNPLLLAGGYAQWTYGFNYWGPVGVNRDTFVLVKKLNKLEW